MVAVSDELKVLASWQHWSLIFFNFSAKLLGALDDEYGTKKGGPKQLPLASSGNIRKLNRKSDGISVP